MRVMNRDVAKEQSAGLSWWWVALGLALALAAALSRAEAPGQLARIKDVAAIEGVVRETWGMSAFTVETRIA